MKEHILIVEDEEKLARFVELELHHEGYIVDKVFDGPAALGKIVGDDEENSEESRRIRYDLVLLDIMLPGFSGLEVIRRMSRVGNETPVILLTARDAVMDKVSGLDAGAVDYITKPFAIEELLARIRVALKHHPVVGGIVNQNGQVLEKKKDDAADEGVFVWKGLTLNEKRHEVRYDGVEIALTNREFLMLKTLLENMDIVLSRDTLLEKVCGYDYVGETNVVDVYVRFLRSKIDETFNVKMIQTIRGVGYVIKSD